MADVTRWVIWGSSGHGKVVAEAIGLRGGLVELLVDNDPLATPCVPSVPLRTGEAGLREWLATDARPGRCAAIAIGGARGADRLQIAALLRGLGVALPAVVHPSSSVSGSARIGAGSHVLAGAVIAADATLGEATIVNHGAVVDHECTLGHGVHVAPGAVLCGCIRVEDHAMVGAGATVLPRLRIGRGAVVGAGAVVTRDVPDGAVVAGNPARALGKGKQ